MAWWAPIAAAGVTAGFGIGGNLITNSHNRKQSGVEFQRNYNAQKEFAQNSIQWKVNDAKNAGIHPIYALGSNGVSYTPSSYMPMFDSNGYESAGNAVGSAIETSFNKDAKEMNRLNMELLRTQIEAQKIANRTAITGQNSNQMNSINDGVSKKVATDILSSSIDKNRAKEIFNPTKSARYSGGDYSQAYDEFATEHYFKNKIAEYLNMPPHERKRVKIDLLKSLGSPGLHVVPKDDLTEFDYQFYNYREKALNQISRFIDFLDRRLFYKGK